MRSWKTERVRAQLLREPNCSAPRSWFNPGVVSRLVKDGHATLTGRGSLMLTAAGREAARVQGKVAQ